MANAGLGNISAEVIIYGDLQIYKLIARGVDFKDHEPSVRFVDVPGGAELLHNIYKCFPAGSPKLAAIGVEGIHTYAAELDRYAAVAVAEGKPNTVYRVRRLLPEMVDPSEHHEAPPSAPIDSQALAGPRVVLIEDLNLGFRDRPMLELQLERHDVVLATQWPLTSPGGCNALWKTLAPTPTPAQSGRRRGSRSGRSTPANPGSPISRRLVVVLNASYLRKGGLEISRGLSWQKSLRQLLKRFKAIKGGMQGASDIIVRLGQEAALHWYATDDATDGKQDFYFYSDRAEDYFKEMYDGDMIGGHALFTAYIGRALAEKEALGDGIRRAIKQVCAWHGAGFGSSLESVAYPYHLIAAKDDKDDKELVVQCEPIGAQSPSSPFFLLSDFADKCPRRDMAARIIKDGPSVLQTYPQARFGDVMWIDPREVESYRHVAALIGEYIERQGEYSEGRTVKPLSIAVFGPPGAGKSFGIKQVADTLAQMQIIEFNLSQWSSADQLSIAFHEIRDASIKARTALVFFDEFDATLNIEYGWLKYFLMPMQDGKFRDGTAEYSLGRCVLVFVGSRSSTFEQFQQEVLVSGPKMEQAKALDFLSRLRGYVNVLGPGEPPDPKDDSLDADPLYIIRRALILRSALEKTARSILVGTRASVDDKVIDLLLEANYAHGARSIEAILEMSGLAGKTAFGLADLPPKDQRKLHVSASNVKITDAR